MSDNIDPFQFGEPFVKDWRVVGKYHGISNVEIDRMALSI